MYFGTFLCFHHRKMQHTLSRLRHEMQLFVRNANYITTKPWKSIKNAGRKVIQLNESNRKGKVLRWRTEAKREKTGNGRRGKSRGRRNAPWGAPRAEAGTQSTPPSGHMTRSTRTMNTTPTMPWRHKGAKPPSAAVSVGRCRQEVQSPFRGSIH